MTNNNNTANTLNNNNNGQSMEDFLAEYAAFRATGPHIDPLSGDYGGSLDVAEAAVAALIAAQLATNVLVKAAAARYCARYSGAPMWQAAARNIAGTVVAVVTCSSHLPEDFNSLQASYAALMMAQVAQGSACGAVAPAYYERWVALRSASNA